MRGLAEIIWSAPRVFLSACCKARCAGNGRALAKKRKAAAAAEGQPHAKVIAARVLCAAETAESFIMAAGETLPALRAGHRQSC